jgi:DNA topoisomerase I
VEHAIELQNARLARLVRKIKDLPGQALFQYVDDSGERHAVSSSDVNAYLQTITGRDYTAKDFRTWSGTLHTFQSLATLEPFENQTQAKKNVVQAISEAARKLGNTPTICRKCYVHPLIIETYMAGKLLEAVEESTEQATPRSQEEPARVVAIEQHVLRLLQQQLAASQKSQ